MAEEILGGLVSVAARILCVCKQSQKQAQRQIYQSDDLFIRFFDKHAPNPPAYHKAEHCNRHPEHHPSRHQRQRSG